MARISFRQGIVRHGKSPGQPFFLQQNGQFVDLVISPDLTIFAFADSNKDYLFTESVTAIKAWGPFSVPQNYWLYLDINRVSGIRTYGSTILPPVNSTTAPAAPVVGKMWFDTSNNKMYEYNGASWVHVLRVFAGILNGANQFLSPVDGVSVESNFTGSQIGITGNITTNAGSLVFDSTGKPIVNQDGKFFTTEDVFTTGVPTGASLKVNNILIRAQANQPIAPYQVVVFSNFNKIALAAPFDFLDKVYGIVEESTPINDVANVITEGIVFNTAWDFINSSAMPPMNGAINDPIYVTSTGELTTDITFSIPGQVALGAIVGLQSILFSPGIYGAGTGGGIATDHGSLTGLADDDHPQYFNQVRGDARYYERTIANSLFAQIIHTHTKSDITDFAHTHVEADITDLDKYTQAQIDMFINGKVSISGSTMTGALTLPADPVNALEAATKQYVDALASGLDAKGSVAVATTFDIIAGSPAGAYNPSGGTGGTGEFTNVNITDLDGFLNVDYNFNLTNRVLVKHQTDARQNGIYIVSNFGGSPYTSATLERAADHDGTPQSEISPGNYTFSGGGATHAGTGWVILAGTATGINDTIILNSDDMNWAAISSATSYSAGLNIDISVGNVISVEQASAGGTVDAKTWNGESVVLSTGSPAISDNEVLLYNTTTFDWRNGYLSFIRNSTNTSNVSINAVTGDVDVLSSGTIDIKRNTNNFMNLNAVGVTTLTSSGNTDIIASGAINLNSIGNTTLTAGTSSILLNNATDITLTSTNGVVVGTPSGQGSVKLVDGVFNTSIEAPPALSANTLFRLPPTNGTVNQILETDGTGITSWANASAGGGIPLCIQDTDGDTFVSVGFNGTPCSDSGNNEIRVQAGNATGYTYAAGYGGSVIIRSGTGNTGYGSGNIQINAADGAYNVVSGNVTITSGSAYGAASGDVKIYGGTGSSNGSTGGDIIIKAGDGPVANNSSGNVIIIAGSLPSLGGESSSNNAGDVHIQTQNPSPNSFNKKTSGNIYLEPAVITDLVGGEGATNGSFTGSVRIQSNGTNVTDVPDLRFYTTNKLKYVAIRSPLAMSGNNVNITMPAGMGTSGQILALKTTTGPTFGVDYGELDFYDQPYDLAAQGIGTLADGDVIMRFVAPRDMEILSSVLASSTPHTGYAVTAPAGAAAVFDVSVIAVNNAVSSIGTITFADGIQRPTASAFASTFVFARQVVVITCTTASGIADVGITVGARARAQ